MPYNGYPDQPEDQREQAWHEPDDAQADGWKGGEPENQGDEWKQGWPEDQAGAEYWLYRKRQNEEEQDGS